MTLTIIPPRAHTMYQKGKQKNQILLFEPTLHLLHRISVQNFREQVVLTQQLKNDGGRTLILSPICLIASSDLPINPLNDDMSHMSINTNKNILCVNRSKI